MASAFASMPRPALRYLKPLRTDGTRNGGAVSSIYAPANYVRIRRFAPKRLRRFSFSGAVRKTTTIAGVVGQSMRVLETNIADIKLLKPVRHVDSQGAFSEVFEKGELFKHGIDTHFVQENQTWSACKGVVRGLHFQSPQAKLSGVTAGSIFDVTVDIRLYVGALRALDVMSRRCSALSPRYFRYEPPSNPQG